MAKVKICGITNQKDLHDAVQLGADFIGFNFYRKSSRFVEPEFAAELCRDIPDHVSVCGVFVNESKESIAEILEQCHIDIIQLHGDETPEDVKAIRIATNKPIIKAFRVSPEFDFAIIDNFEIEYFLLDSYSSNEFGGTGVAFNWDILEQFTDSRKERLFLAGGITPENVGDAVDAIQPFAIDVASGVEQTKRVKDYRKLRSLIRSVKRLSLRVPDDYGYFGEFGGNFVPETLVAPLDELKFAFADARLDIEFQLEFEKLLRQFSGRPTPLTYAERLSEHLGGARIYLKREDLNHTGAHKITNCIGQILLAKRMGKKRIIAETGAGQHGVATATVCALMGLECVVYMGSEDMRRQALNVYRMQLLGAKVCAVDSGSKTLKDAINEALRDWVTNVETSFYLLGSALGPHPYPQMVAEFQSVIGIEAREQILQAEGKLPNDLIACVGGGSNSIGLFKPFLNDEDVRMTGVEAGGMGNQLGEHAARFMSESGERIGVLHGTKSYVLQDSNGQIAQTHSISAGLDYPSIGPEHAQLHFLRRVKYQSMTDSQALEAFHTLSRFEGIIPALESSHAIAYALKAAPISTPDSIMIVNLSGRGDKDIDTVRAIALEEFK